MPESTKKISGIYKGDIRTVTFTLYDADEVLIDTSVPSSIKFTARTKREDTTYQFEITCAQVGDGSGGQCTADLTATHTDTSGTYIGRVRATYSGGDILTFPEFVFIISD